VVSEKRNLYALPGWVEVRQCSREGVDRAVTRRASLLAVVDEKKLTEVEIGSGPRKVLSGSSKMTLFQRPSR
jgi:hypothetical protein